VRGGDEGQPRNAKVMEDESGMGGGGGCKESGDESV